MAFKIFEEYGAAARDEATLRISGYLFISKGLQNRVNAEESSGAVLLYDDDKKRIGIKFYKEFDADNAAMRNISKEKSGVAINVLPLLRYYGIKKPKEKQTLKASTEDDILVIDIEPLIDISDTTGEIEDLL